MGPHIPARGQRTKTVDNHRPVDRSRRRRPPDPLATTAGCTRASTAARMAVLRQSPLHSVLSHDLDNSLPVYPGYGGTQDTSRGAARRARAARAGSHSDWFVTGAADGFQTRVYPKDRQRLLGVSHGISSASIRTGRVVNIVPTDDPPPPLVLDSPLIITLQHRATVLRFSAAVSRTTAGTAGEREPACRVDRPEPHQMMDGLSVDAVAKNTSSSSSCDRRGGDSTQRRHLDRDREESIHVSRTRGAAKDPDPGAYTTQVARVTPPPRRIRGRASTTTCLATTIRMVKITDSCAAVFGRGNLRVATVYVIIDDPNDPNLLSRRTESACSSRATTGR